MEGLATDYAVISWVQRNTVPGIQAYVTAMGTKILSLVDLVRKQERTGQCTGIALRQVVLHL